MSELEYLLRLQSPANKELKTSVFDVFGSPAKFTSQLTSGYTRKGFGAYNNSGPASGEIVWGPKGVTAETGIPIPKGAMVDIPIGYSPPSEGKPDNNVDVYFCNTVSGEIGNLRIVEIA